MFQGSEVFPNELEVPNMFRYQESRIVGFQQRLLRSPQNIGGKGVHSVNLASNLVFSRLVRVWSYKAATDLGRH